MKILTTENGTNDFTFIVTDERQEGNDVIYRVTSFDKLYFTEEDVYDLRLALNNGVYKVKEIATTLICHEFNLIENGEIKNTIRSYTIKPDN